jgi:hypothetical protein
MFFRHRPIDGFYPEWIRRYDTLIEHARERMRAEIAGWTAAPQISPGRAGWPARSSRSARSSIRTGSHVSPSMSTPETAGDDNVARESADGWHYPDCVAYSRKEELKT